MQEYAVIHTVFWITPVKPTLGIAGHSKVTRLTRKEEAQFI